MADVSETKASPILPCFYKDPGQQFRWKAMNGSKDILQGMERIRWRYSSALAALHARMFRTLSSPTLARSAAGSADRIAENSLAKGSPCGMIPTIVAVGAFYDEYDQRFNL